MEPGVRARLIPAVVLISAESRDGRVSALCSLAVLLVWF